MGDDLPKVYALIATHMRNDLLQTRSLPSVKIQTRPVDGVILVDDSPNKNVRKENRRIFDSCFQSDEDHIYLVNERTPGAAGSWNHGLDWLYKKSPEAWVAILDDDDEWTKEHIAECIKKSTNVDLVLASITTLKDGKESGIRTSEKMTINEFYAGNPGWQGSNTFIKLKSLRESGCFDEELLCTHDRDLAIRWLHYGKGQYNITRKPTVRYHLETEKEALTTTSGKGKWTGLLQFYKKHVDNMDESNIKSFKKRAKDLFRIDISLFNLVNEDDEYPGFPRSPYIGENILKRTLFLKKFQVSKTLSTWRSHRLLTKLFGPTYKRSRDKIEIDLTYVCNLGCHDCNRSCKQAPESLEIKLSTIRKFVENSIRKGIEWKKIRLLGGEPTLHSQFEEILYNLAKYKLQYPRTRLEIVTNGYQRKVKRQLLKVPPYFHIENSNKTTNEQSHFYPFNVAPCDLPCYERIDFTNGCSNIEECGMGLTPLGYYPCAISGGIDRIAGWNIARKEIPDYTDDMLDILSKACPLCGRFIPRNFMPYDVVPRVPRGQMSSSWKTMYRKWEKRMSAGEEHA